MITDIE